MGKHSPKHRVNTKTVKDSVGLGRKGSVTASLKTLNFILNSMKKPTKDLKQGNGTIVFSFLENQFCNRVVNELKQ